MSAPCLARTTSSTRSRHSAMLPTQSWHRSKTMWSAKKWMTGARSTGHPAKKGWPSDATIVLRKTSGRTLTDLLGTIKNTVFASPALREVIARHCKDVEIEYLPFELVDHRQRTDQDLRHRQSAGDTGLSRCGGKRHPLGRRRTEQGARCKRLRPVLSAKKLKKAPRCSAASPKARFVHINNDLAQDIQKAKLTNVVWTLPKVK